MMKGSTLPPGLVELEVMLAWRVVASQLRVLQELGGVQMTEPAQTTLLARVIPFLIQ